MEIEFDDPDLERLEAEEGSSRFAPAVVKGFKKATNFIRAAVDERDLRLPGLNFKPLEGNRVGQHSMKLNDQWRLILEVRGEGKQKKVGVIEIADYH